MDFSPDKDYYKVLGVPENATEKEIQTRFRKLSRETHPDLHPGDKEAEAKFKEYSEAYDVLSSKDKREEYDNIRKYGSTGGADPFEAMFQHMRGNAARRRPSGPMPEHGEILKAAIKVNFSDTVFGTDKTIRVPVKKRCHHCDATGSKSGKMGTCPHCHGTGVLTQRNSGFMFQQTCYFCNGTGQAPLNDCPHCDGGFTKETKEFKVHIPAGIRTDSWIEVSREGNQGRFGGSDGIVVACIIVQDYEDCLFEYSPQEAFDLYTDHTISFYKAVFGGEEEIMTPYGMAKVKIPAGSSDGRLVRIAGKGLSRNEYRKNMFSPSDNGDLYVRLHIEVPTEGHITSEQKSKLREFFEEKLDTNANTNINREAQKAKLYENEIKDKKTK